MVDGDLVFYTFLYHATQQWRGIMVLCWTSVSLPIHRLFVCPSIFLLLSFPDDNLSRYQWIFTKLGMCIDIVEIWFGIVNGPISSIC